MNYGSIDSSRRRFREWIPVQKRKREAESLPVGIMRSGSYFDIVSLTDVPGSSITTVHLQRLFWRNSEYDQFSQYRNVHVVHWAPFS